jgi:rhamnosyltransferase subunit B
VSETTLHYLIITVGTTGDIHPFMRIASALQALRRKITL